MNINARYPGSTHDAYIWNNSNVKNAIHLYRRYPNNNFYLVGDSGYSLRPWMMTPIIDAPENSPEAASQIAKFAKNRSCKILLQTLLAERIKIGNKI
ncbi:hypothetical protein ALC62_15099 [Cyphomyrmex costatus]|uniref:DDE Tnp4 domain-containing protein n=2 Tax=Cyphomyrmex costatus TaxID=456900 RepID=A0A151I824_9HYME|nr:hypothetical protein ALC62_15099 [Cyphomyrmex costatus]